MTKCSRGPEELGTALDGYPGARHTQGMAYARVALLAVLAFALAGCAATPSRPLDYPPGAFYVSVVWRSPFERPLGVG